MPDPRPDALHARLRTAQMPDVGIDADTAGRSMLDALNAALLPRPTDSPAYATGGVLPPRAVDPLADAYGSGPWLEPRYPHRDPHQPAYDEDAYRD